MRKMTGVLAVLALLTCAGAALGQNEQYIVSGRVLDSQTEQGAEGVLVSVYDEEAAPVGDVLVIGLDGNFSTSLYRGEFVVCLETQEYELPPPGDWNQYSCRVVTLTAEKPSVSLGDIYVSPKVLSNVEASFEVWPWTITLRKGANLWAAILPSSGFDPTNIDLTTIRLGPAGIKPCVWRVKVGKKSLVALFVSDVTKLGLVPGDTSVCFESTTKDARRVRGCDTITVKNPHSKRR